MKEAERAVDAIWSCRFALLCSYSSWLSSTAIYSPTYNFSRKFWSSLFHSPGSKANSVIALSKLPFDLSLPSFTLPQRTVGTQSSSTSKINIQLTYVRNWRPCVTATSLILEFIVVCSSSTRELQVKRSSSSPMFPIANSFLSALRWPLELDMDFVQSMSLSWRSWLMSSM